MAVVQSEGALVAAMAPWTPTLGISRGITNYAGDFSDFAAVFRTQPNVRLVVSFLARNIAHLNLKAFRAVSDTDRQAIPRSHQLARMIRQPNPYTTRHRFIDALVHDRKVYDNFFALKVRNRVTSQLNLFRIPPYMIEPIGSGWFRPDGWRLIAGTDRPEFPVDAVLHLRGYNPSDARLGHSPIDTLRRILAEDTASGEWREQYWRGAARMSGVIERPETAPNWTPTARNRFRDDWRAAYAGSSELAAATPVLEEGMVWKEAGFSPKDSEYLGARVLTRGEVAAQYHVSPLFVGILENANFSNVAEQHKHLYQDTLGPDLDEYEEDFALQLLPEFPDLDPDETYFEFNLAEKLKGTFEEQASVLQTLVGAPVMVRDEGRARLNLPPLPNGDGEQIVTPLNVLVGGLPSPTAPPPPTPPGSAARKGRRRSLPPARAKAIDELPATVRGWAAKHEEVLTSFFARQRDAVMSRLGSGQSVDEAFDAARWNEELTNDLTALAVTMAADVGAPVAERFGGTYDEALTEAWLHENARIAAENTNEVTRAALVSAFAAPTSGTASRRKDTAVALDPSDDEEVDSGLPDPLDAAGTVFDLALATRVAELALSRTTTVGNFASHEGASQAGARVKVWVVNSRNSRHPEMDGETAAMGEAFSNGGVFPGDPALGVAENAGCHCTLDFATEEP